MTGSFAATFLGLLAVSGVFSTGGGISNRSDAGGTASYWDGVSFNSSLTARSSSETRPSTFSIRFYIRYK